MTKREFLDYFAKNHNMKIFQAWLNIKHLGIRIEGKITWSIDDMFVFLEKKSITCYRKYSLFRPFVYIIKKVFFNPVIVNILIVIAAIIAGAILAVISHLLI